MTDDNNIPQEENAGGSSDSSSNENIYEKNVRSKARGRYTNEGIVSHLEPLRSHCDTELMKATYNAIMDDFKTKAKLDEAGKGIKFLEQLHEIAIEVSSARMALDDKSEQGIEHKLRRLDKKRKELFRLDGVPEDKVPSLHTPDYMTPVERLGRIKFREKTYTSEEFYKLIEQITTDLYSGDDAKLTNLRNRHSRESSVSSLKIKEFEERAELAPVWQEEVDTDTREIEKSNHYKMHVHQAHIKQCEQDIKDLS